MNGHTRLLHDGRARGVLEAVLWHGGEAEAAKDQVLKMKKADRDALVKFVESLLVLTPTLRRCAGRCPPEGARFHLGAARR